MKLRVHSTGHGSKTAAVIHGISAEAALFADLTDRLADDYGYTVLAVDLRGHGESPRADDYALAAFADDVVETLPSGLDVVMGHSLGCRVLLDAVSRLLPGKAVYLDPAFAINRPVDVTDRSNVGQHPDRSFYSLAELEAENPGWGQANLLRVQEAHSHWDDSMFERLLPEVGAAPAPDAAPVVPSLVLRGEYSPLVSEGTVERLRELGWEVRVQSGAGHNVQLDDIDEMLRRLDGWI